MARVVVTPEADADLAFIIEDLFEKAGARVANRYEADFDSVLNRLVDLPQSGAPRPSLGKHVRICVVSPYVVIYEHISADETVTIMRVAHGRRRITRKFVRDKID